MKQLVEALILELKENNSIINEITLGKELTFLFFLLSRDNFKPV